MFGWCDQCQAIATEGICSKHGSTRPLSFIASVDVRPLSSFEKQFFNDRMDDLILDEGIFLVYSDRMRRRMVIFLDIPLVEVRFQRDTIHIDPLAKGHIRGMNIDPFLATNRERLSRMVELSQALAEHELKQIRNAVISYSGGKDSAVLADVLGKFGFTRVFIDTRLEFSETYRYINNLRANGCEIDIAKASTSFFSLVGKNGYPKSGNRWCCKTQKFEPFSRYIRERYGTQDVIVFIGERRWEAMYRLGEPFKRRHRYITNQITIEPLLDWLTLDIWNYIWAKKLPINPIYEVFDRSGCWLCPFGLQHRIFLMQFSHPKLYKILLNTHGTEPSGEKHLMASVNEKKPCTTILDGKRVNTCDIYGHFYLKGRCFRCGTREPQLAKVS